MKTKTGVSGILIGAMLLFVVFGALVFGPQVLENARAFEPTYLEFMNESVDYKGISLAIDNEDAQMTLKTKDGEVFGVAESTVEVSTVNPTGYTMSVATVGKDHGDVLTNALIHTNKLVKKDISSIKSDVAATRLNAEGEDEGGDVWEAETFPSNHWGLGTSFNGRDYTFTPVSTSANTLKTTDVAKDKDLTGVVVGVKVDKETPPGEYENTLEFTVLANPVPFTYTVKYNANGGTNAPEDYSVVVFDELSHVVTLPDSVPTRTKHGAGDWIFLGWSESSSATAATYEPGDKITLAAADGSLAAGIQLYAVWQKSYNYALEFAPGVSGDVANLPVTMTVTSTGDGVFIIPATAPSCSGYVFTGYTDGSRNYQPGDTYTIASSAATSDPTRKTLTAVWQKKYNYVLKFEAGISGTVTNLPGTMTTTSTGDGVFTIPGTAPSRSGHTFAGYTDGSQNYQPGDTYRISSSASSSDPIAKTLKAKWNQNCSLNCSEVDVGVGGVVNYEYTGSVKSVTVKQPGTYKLEVWGAQGVDYSSSYTGGLGGYGTGETTFSANTVLYIAVGGKGVSFNGGVATYSTAHYGSGGATHIATRSGQLSSLSGYTSSILIVAGGGGGACTTGSGGYGGGANQSGGTGAGGYSNRLPGTGGTLTAGGYPQAGNYASSGSFGQGGTNTAGSNSGGSMGGGGYYGGGAGGSDYTSYNDNDDGSGGGGSGYANTSKVTKISGTSGARSGHGYARITYMRSS